MHRWALLVALLLVSPASSALADTQTNNCGRYSIWVPDDWKVTINGERIDAESRDNEINMSWRRSRTNPRICLMKT